MTSLSNQIKQKNLFLTCVAVSVAIHVGVLLYFYIHPIIIHSYWKSLFGLSTATPELLEFDKEELIEKNRVLREVFQNIAVTSPHLQHPLDLIEIPQGIALSPREEHPSSLPLDLPSSLEIIPPDSAYAHIQPTPFVEENVLEPFFLPEEETSQIASQLNIDLIPDAIGRNTLELPPNLLFEEANSTLEYTAISDLILEAQPEKTTAGVNILDQLPLLKTEEEATPLKIETSAWFTKTESPRFDSTSAVAPVLFLPETPPLTSLTPGTIPVDSPIQHFDDYNFPSVPIISHWNDDFDVQVQFLPNPEGSGYIFSLSLAPSIDVGQYSLKQNFYFLLDRSNSVQKHRFAVFKRAVAKAIASMQPCDAFNIYIIDKQITRMNSVPILYSKKSAQAAEDFMEKQEAGSYFAASDIYSSLEKILPEIDLENEVHTAILLTDGNTLLSPAKQQRVLSQWSQKNNGKLSLYTAAVGKKNNLIMLDLLSSIAGGKLLYSDTHAAFPRRLAKLILELRDPVAKDLMITAIPANPDVHIELHPNFTHLPAIYSHQPYVIMGSIDKPCDFNLVIEGRHGDEWISIDKRISFMEGEKAEPSLKKRWEAQQTGQFYSKFLDEGKSVYIKEAKEILKKSRSELAFE